MLDNTSAIVDFTNDNTTDSFKVKEKITGHSGNNCTKSVAIIVPLKYQLVFGELLKCHLLIVK